ncbi:MAG: single-stranded-DNA-specific exonuclease RecJ [Candidatus Eisenbacteria bacterium]
MTVQTAGPEWVLHPRYAPAVALPLAEQLGAPPAIGHALVHRGLVDGVSAARFLSPSLDDLHEPSGLLDVDRAVARIRHALANHERVFVQGDYDVDGITSTFLMVSVLRELGAEVVHRIPHRTRDGYGLSVAAVEEARERSCTLIVTVDCGITAVEPVAAARAAGIDTVITDHHEPGPRMPDAVAVVNPHRSGDRYAFKALAGVGVTFKVAQALWQGRGGIERVLSYLDVVALGTIADVVPLVGENRVLAHEGLKHLQTACRPGLAALIESAGLTGRRITDGHVAFVLAPRINAAGRMGHADQALRLLFARDREEGASLAESLEEENTRRRTFDEAAAREASERVVHELHWPECAAIVLWSEHWHPGVLGIVASRLVERFQRPTVLLSVDGDTVRGSGRSAGGLDLIRVLEACDDLLASHGGHAFAAGLTTTRDRLPELRERIERLVRERFAHAAAGPRLVLDGDVRLAECDLALADWVQRLAPFGLDNGEPVYRARDLWVDSATRVGEGRHLRIAVRDAGGSAEAIGFGMGERVAELQRGRRVELAFVPTRNEWMGQSRLQLRLKGMRVG